MAQPLPTIATRLLALGLALGVVSAPALAQQQVSAKELQKAGFFNDFDELDLESLLTGEVVEARVATGFAAPLSEAPGSVTVFDEDAIRDSGARTLRELLQTVPGFDTVLGALGQDQFFVRGVRDRTFASSAPVLVLYNGVALNEPAFGGATGIHLDIPLANIDRVEILRGAGSALYGPQALAAVVSLESRGIGDVRGMRLTVGGGSFRGKRASLEMGSRIKGVGVAGFLLFDDHEQTGLTVARDAQSLRDASDGTHFSRAPGELADDRRSFTTSYQIGVRGFSLDWHVVQEQGGGRFGEIQSLAVQNRLTNRQMIISPAWSGSLAGGEARVRASYVQSQFGELAELYPPGFELEIADGRIVLPSGVLFQASLKTRGLGADVSWSRALGSHRVLLGAAWRDERTGTLEANGNVDFRDFTLKEGLDPLPGVVQAVERQTASAFGHLTLQPAGFLRLHAGARVDDVSELSAALVSPRVAAVALLPKGASAFAAWSRGYRLPGFAETAFELPGLHGTAGLEPERNDALEAGLRFAVKGLNVQAVAFRARVQGPLTPADARYDVSQPSRVVSGADYDATGLEFDARGGVGRHTLFANLTLQRSEVDGAEDLFDVPKVLASAGAALRFGRFVVSPGVVYHGVRPRALGDPRADTPAHAVARLSVQTRDLFRRWDFAAFVTNLFGKQYADPAPLGGTPDGYPRLGRVLQAHAIFRF